MTSTAASGQDSAFASLHPQIQELRRHELGWRRLRPVQAAAVPHVLAARRDVLIVSATATGKTEAAWLPIFSSLLRQPVPGLGVLCVSPLKTLIDDQVKRLARYGRHLDVRVEGWHGDVASSRKQRLLSEPPLALVTTPESLQGILLHRRQTLAAAAAGLRYVVVDEVHAFAGTDRGHQLQHLLGQLERLAGARTCRVALSATVSKPNLIAEFLRPGTGDAAVVVQPSSREAGQLDVRVFGFLTRPSMTRRSKTERGDRDLNVRDVADGDRLDIARQIDNVTRGRRALVFAGSRLAVEEMTALVRDVNVTGTRRPDRFLAHHGSLSRELRRTAEVALHERDDATVICTSTLELGVDLPHLDLVAQVDTCLSVATLRQRLGRSGRKPGTRPKLRVYSAERPLAPQEAPSTRLRAGLAQNVASIELIVRENWVEPADLAPLGLSTLLQQTLAMLADPAGSSARRLFEQLCIRGPWRRVSSTQFAGLLRSLGEHGLIRQDGRRLLLLDEAGQKLVGRRDFVTAFTTPTDYTLRHEGKELGTLPISYPLTIGASLAFAGRTWRVAEVHAGGWVVDVVPHHNGLPPIFKGDVGRVHERVRQQMRVLYEEQSTPTYLDERARSLLAEARSSYREYGLDTRSVVSCGDDVSLLAPWTGDRELATLRRWLELRNPGLSAQAVPVGLVVPVDEATLRTIIRSMADGSPPTEQELSAGVLVKQIGKYDRFLPEHLLCAEYASRTFDLKTAEAVLRTCLRSRRRASPA